jgi:hypothetical protein
LNVLVIPEDFRKDQYILKPIIEAMMAACGRPHAKVIVCKDPVLGGISQALRWENLKDIFDRYRGMVDLFLLCVDRDGVASRKARMTELEARAAADLPADRIMLAENAWQELEVWVLAGHDLPGDWAWHEIRAEMHPKERYYTPYVRLRDMQDQPAEGRRALSIDAARRYDRIKRLCPEDVATLEERIRGWMARLI